MLVVQRRFGKLRRLPSGRWQASYIGPDAVRHTAESTFGAKLDAEGWLGGERRLIELGSWSPPVARRAQRRAESVTLGEYLSTWIAERPLKPRTREGYESTARRFVTGTPLAGMALTAITTAGVRAWYARLPVGAPTARAHAYGLVHSVLATAVTDELIPANPAKIARAMNAPTRRSPVILEAAEVAELAEVIEPCWRALVLIAAWVGPRWGECIELHRRDIGLDAATITVARAATHRNGVCTVSTTKSGRVRTVTVPPHIRPVILDHLERLTAPGLDAQLFAAARGGCHLNDKVFRERFTSALATIGRDDITLPRPRFHDLRHFAGTVAASVGSLRETMDRLGHSTQNASLRYQGIASGRDAEVADALSRLAAVSKP